MSDAKLAKQGEHRRTNVRLIRRQRHVDLVLVNLLRDAEINLGRRLLLRSPAEVVEVGEGVNVEQVD